MQTQSASSTQAHALAPSDLDADDARYRALLARDVRAEGQFFYAVATTGIYCRPTCAARPPLRANVSFHATAALAERAGFRACRRCRPRDPSQRERHAHLVAQARAALEVSDEPVRLAALAADAGLSPHHFHRLFRAHVGMTPQQYGAACRLRKFGALVREGRDVTTAIHAAGYGSSSRFYEAGGALGMAPSALRRGAEGEPMRTTLRSCGLGQVLIAATARGICAISFGADAAALDRELRARFPRATFAPCDPALDQLADVIVRALDGAGLAADLPLDLIGTAFQQRVWRALRDVPAGATITYAALAEKLGAPRAVRAVGTACGANPVAVVVPCHRVVRSDGTLGGYRWGTARKQALLARERGK